MSDTELKPCPFCGGEAQLFEPALSRWTVLHNCRVIRCNIGFGTRRDVASLWNRRSFPKPPPPREGV